MPARQLIAILAFTATIVVSSAAAAWDQYPFDQYTQRGDTVTLGAGDAQRANTVTHVIDPWPRYSGNTRIPGNGQRMSDAVERYRDVSKAPKPQPPGIVVNIGTAASQ